MILNALCNYLTFARVGFLTNGGLMLLQKVVFDCVCFCFCFSFVCLFCSAFGLLRLRIICAAATDIHVHWNLDLTKLPGTR